MLRKITLHSALRTLNLFAALLCLVMASLCHAQTTPKPTVTEALTSYLGGTNTACRYVDVYALLPSNVNADPLRTTKYYVAFYLYGTSSVIGSNAYNVTMMSGMCVVTEQPDGFRATYATTPIPVLSEASGTVVNMAPPAPSLTANRDFVRNVYGRSGIETWYRGYNTALSNVPATLPGGFNISKPGFPPVMFPN